MKMIGGVGILERLVMANGVIRRNGELLPSSWGNSLIYDECDKSWYPSFDLLHLTNSLPRVELTFIQDGGLLYVEVDPSGIDSWKLDPIIEQLREGAVGVIPTDTVYDALLFLLCFEDDDSI